ncbi:MAG: hypothetical protein ACLFR1_16040, partial [Spirochaetia bacterium]
RFENEQKAFQYGKHLNEEVHYPEDWEHFHIEIGFTSLKQAITLARKLKNYSMKKILTDGLIWGQ